MSSRPVVNLELVNLCIDVEGYRPDLPYGMYFSQATPHIVQAMHVAIKQAGQTHEYPPLAA